MPHQWNIHDNASQPTTLLVYYLVEKTGGGLKWNKVVTLLAKSVANAAVIAAVTKGSLMVYANRSNTVRTAAKEKHISRHLQQNIARK